MKAKQIPPKNWQIYEGKKNPIKVFPERFSGLLSKGALQRMEALSKTGVGDKKVKRAKAALTNLGGILWGRSYTNGGRRGRLRINLFEGAKALDLDVLKSNAIRVDLQVVFVDFYLQFITLAELTNLENRVGVDKEKEEGPEGVPVYKTIKSDFRGSAISVQAIEPFENKDLALLEEFNLAKQDTVFVNEISLTDVMISFIDISIKRDNTKSELLKWDNRIDRAFEILTKAGGFSGAAAALLAVMTFNLSILFFSGGLLATTLLVFFGSKIYSSTASRLLGNFFSRSEIFENDFKDILEGTDVEMIAKSLLEVRQQDWDKVLVLLQDCQNNKASETMALLEAEDKPLAEERLLTSGSEEKA